jgi:hypothetical protein
MAINLRAFAFIDQFQKQFVGYISTAAKGFYPVPGQSGLFIEIAPGIEINTITDVLMKKANVLPGALVVERTYGMLEVHSDSPADIEEAGRVILEYLGLKETDRLKPRIISSDIIERADPYMTVIVNRFRDGNMLLSDETLYFLEVTPAAYAGFAANEAEKSADIKLIHASVFGASGKIYIAGTSSDVKAAREAVEIALKSLDGIEEKK